MKPIKILIVIFFLNIPTFLIAEDYSADLYNIIGINYTNISGYGIFYNRKLSDDFHLQIMGLAYYLYSEENDVIHKNFNYEAGLELQLNIFKWSVSRLYLLAGAYYYLDDDKKEGPGGKFNSIINHSFNVGTGMAYQFIFHRFVIYFTVGYKFYEDNLDITADDKTYPELKRVTKLGAGIGLGFMF